MTLPTAIVAFDVSDMLGIDFWEGRAKATMTVDTNIADNTVVDVDGNEIRVGTGSVLLDQAGKGVISVWTPGPGSIPETWQSTLLLEFPDRSTFNKRGKKSFGPFTITGTTRTVSNKALTTNVATITTSTPHRLAVGNPVTIAGVDATFNGTHTITAVPSATTLSFAKTASNVASAAATGTLTSPHVRLVDLVEEMDIMPVYASAFLDRLDGIDDHGNVSGAVTISPTKGLHGLDATGPTVLTLADPPGNTVSVKVVTGADNVTIDGMPGAELTDNAWSTFVYFRGAWELASAGGSAGEPDVTPPTAVTDLSAEGGENEIVLAWSAATDDESTVSYAYRVWLTTAGASGGWSTTTNLTVPVSGLPAGDYTAQVYAVSPGGSTVPDSATATVTGAGVWAVHDSWSFTGSNGTSIATLTSDVVGQVYAYISGAAFITGNKVVANANGTGENVLFIYADATVTDRRRTIVDYDLTTTTVSYVPSVELVGALGTGGIVVKLDKDGDAGANAILSCTTDYSGSPTITYESGKTSTLPLTGKLTMEIRWDTDDVLIYHDDDLIGTVDTSGLLHSGSPNPIDRDGGLGFRIGARGATVDNHRIELYS